MIRRAFLTAALCLIVAGCANPVNRATSDRYAKMCAEAYQNRLLDVAEEACYRAVVNVDLGNLGPELKSQRLLNLALIKRALRKPEEAESLLKESLRIEETLSGASSEKTGRRLAQLAAVKYQRAQYMEGFSFLERLEPIVDQYSKQERFFVAALFHCYALQAEQIKQTELAARWRLVSSNLHVFPNDPKCDT